MACDLWLRFWHLKKQPPLPLFRDQVQAVEDFDSSAQPKEGLWSSQISAEDTSCLGPHVGLFLFLTYQLLLHGLISIKTLIPAHSQET